MDRKELKNWAKEKITGNIGGILLGVIIILGIELLFSICVSIYEYAIGQNNITSFISIIIELLLLPLEVGLNKYVINFIKTEEFNKNLIFEPYEDAAKIIGTIIIMLFLISIGLIVFIIPGIYLSLSYSLVPYLLATNRELSMFETLRLSREMMKGHILDYFVLVLSFIGWLILSVFTFGILLIWLYPYMITTITKFSIDIIESYEK